MMFTKQKGKTLAVLMFVLVLTIYLSQEVGAVTYRLQDAETEILEDTLVIETYVYDDFNFGAYNALQSGEDNFDNETGSYVKYDITSLPADSVISNAMQCNYIPTNLYDTGETITATIYGVDNQTWMEGNGTTSAGLNCSVASGCQNGITWNTMPDKGNLLDTNNTFDGDDNNFWICFNVTEFTNSSFNGSDSNTSFYINATREYGQNDRILFYSKEDVTASTYHYLDIIFTSETLDIINPNMTISSPINTSYSAEFDLNITVSENATWCGYNFDGGTNTTLLNDTKTNWFIEVTPGSDGTQQLNVYCNDSTGNYGLNDTIWLTYDTTAPVVLINASPINQTYNFSSSLPININVTVTDASTNISTCLWNLDDGTNATMLNSSTTVWYIQTNSSLEDEYTYQLNIYCNDTENNWGLNNSIWFTYNDDSIVVTITNPVTGTYNNNGHTLTVTTDVSADTCQYMIGPSDSNNTMSGSGTSWSSEILVPAGTTTIWVYCLNGTYYNQSSASIGYSTGGGGGGGGGETYINETTIIGSTAWFEGDGVCDWTVGEPASSEDCQLEFSIDSVQMLIIFGIAILVAYVIVTSYIKSQPKKRKKWMDYV